MVDAAAPPDSVARLGLITWVTPVAGLISELEALVSSFGLFRFSSSSTVTVVSVAVARLRARSLALRTSLRCDWLRARFA